MQAMFAQARHKKRNGDDALFFEGSPATRHPRSGAVVQPYALATEMPAEALAAPAGDRRQILADWLTRSDNPFFARNMANRVWARFLGRGLVEPVDDFRETNPPTNPELLDALAQRLVEAKFDFHSLIRDITSSLAYQRSPHPNATNQADEQNYSRALLKKPPAEVLFDAVCQTTAAPEKFAGMPNGYRAIQLWDSRTSHYFLKLFGRPLRETACECERNAEASVAQVLHLMNSPEIQAKLSYSGGAVRRMEREFADNGALAEELYLNFYSRYPTDAERSAAVEYLAKSAGNRRQAAEDLAWSMLNSLEFVFNH